MPNQINAPSESIEQQCIFRWAGYSLYKYPELDLLYHIPNGGLRNKRVAIQLKSEGVKSGIPDLHLPVARGGYNSLYIELKKIGGKVTANQKEWIKKLNEQGNLAVVCYGSEDAQKVLEDYLNNKIKELK